MSKDATVTICGERGQVAVEIFRDGSVKYGPAWAGTETCKRFWELLAQMQQQLEDELSVSPPAPKADVVS